MERNENSLLRFTKWTISVFHNITEERKKDILPDILLASYLFNEILITNVVLSICCSQFHGHVISILNFILKYFLMRFLIYLLIGNTEEEQFRS